MQKQCIGISIASLFPWVNIFPWEITHYFLKRFIDYIEVYPMRGISPNTIFDIRVQGISAAWNPGSLTDVIVGMRNHDFLAPKMHDYLMFPGKEESHETFVKLNKKYESSYSTAHSINQWKWYSYLKKEVYLEVHPGLYMTTDKIIEWAKNKGKVLALDLYHLRRQLRADELLMLNIDDPTSKLGYHRSTLMKLLPYCALIHLSTDRDSDELERFINNEDTEFEKMLMLIKNNYEGDFLVEIVPKNKLELLFFPLWCKKIKKFVKKVKTILEIPG